MITAPGRVLGTSQSLLPLGSTLILTFRRRHLRRLGFDDLDGVAIGLATELRLIAARFPALARLVGWEPAWRIGRLALLNLVHGIENAEIMLRVLEIALGHYPVAGPCRIAAQLKVFLKQLLRCPTQPHIRPARIEDMIPIHRLLAGLAELSTAAAAASTSAPTAPVTMAAATHAFYVHFYEVCRLAGGPQHPAGQPGRERLRRSSWSNPTGRRHPGLPSPTLKLDANSLAIRLQ